VTDSDWLASFAGPRESFASTLIVLALLSSTTVARHATGVAGCSATQPLSDTAHLSKAPGQKAGERSLVSRQRDVEVDLNSLTPSSAQSPQRAEARNCLRCKGLRNRSASNQNRMDSIHVNIVLTSLGRTIFLRSRSHGFCPLRLNRGELRAGKASVKKKSASGEVSI